MNQSTTRKCLAPTILILSLCAIACEDTSDTARYGLHSELRDSAGVIIV